ncbi:hypothetical protein Tco_1003605 [Tanacetum coccineum]|uniref:Uncharacterized protein n=1 Tax=Tanacetum coccineum TaxID=301880 RepID=A0ABQ5FBF6_9ASTR
MEYCKDEDDNFTNFETEYPAIVFDDTSDADLSCEPHDSKNENDQVNMPSSLSPEPTIGYIDDLDFFKDFENEFPAIAYNDDLKSKSDSLIEHSVNMEALPSRDQRHPWLKYKVEGYGKDIVHNYEQRLETIWGRSVNRVYVLDFSSLTEGMRQTLGDRLKMVYTRDEGQVLFTSHAWRSLFEIKAPLVREFILEFLSTCRMSDTEMGLDVEEMAEAGFGAYWQGSERVIPDKGDLRDYWIEILSDKDFLGPAPSYVFIQDPMRRLCHRMIACSISGKGQAPEKVTGVDLFYLRSIDRGTANVPYLLAQYLFRHAEVRNSGSRLFGGHFIGCPTAHFGLVSDQGLRGLSMVTRELLLIDLHELRRLNICFRIGD